MAEKVVPILFVTVFLIILIALLVVFGPKLLNYSESAISSLRRFVGQEESAPPQQPTQDFVLNTYISEEDDALTKVYKLFRYFSLNYYREEVSTRKFLYGVFELNFGNEEVNMNDVYDRIVQGFNDWDRNEPNYVIQWSNYNFDTKIGESKLKAIPDSPLRFNTNCWNNYNIGDTLFGEVRPIYTNFQNMYTVDKKVSGKIKIRVGLSIVSNTIYPTIAICDEINQPATPPIAQNELVIYTVTDKTSFTPTSAPFSFTFINTRTKFAKPATKLSRVYVYVKDKGRGLVESQISDGSSTTVLTLFGTNGYGEEYWHQIFNDGYDLKAETSYRLNFILRSGKSPNFFTKSGSMLAIIYGT